MYLSPFVASDCKRRRSAALVGNYPIRVMTHTAVCADSAVEAAADSAHVHVLLNDTKHTLRQLSPGG